MHYDDSHSSKSRWKNCFLGCAAGCGATGVALFGAAVIILLKMSAVPPEMALPSRGASTAPPSLPQHEPPPYETQLQQIEQAARSGQPTAVTLRLSEAQINELVQRNAEPSSTVRNVRVFLGRGDITLVGTGYLRGRQVYVSAIGRPAAMNGRPRLHLHTVRVGTLRLPGQAVAQLQAQLDKAMDDWAAKNPYDVTDASVYDGQLVISGLTRPR